MVWPPILFRLPLRDPALMNRADKRPFPGVAAQMAESKSAQGL
jgi:hypothetical protein